MQISGTKNSSMPGTNILDSSITNIEKFGFWIILIDKEYFISYNDYPQFKNATIQQIFDYTLCSPTQICWENLNVDIEVEALENPSHFTLVYK